MTATLATPCTWCGELAGHQGVARFGEGEAFEFGARCVAEDDVAALAGGEGAARAGDGDLGVDLALAGVGEGDQGGDVAGEVDAEGAVS
ncbi:MAG: hypothetical protein U0841_20065 [Chloroflexia bacterium]